MLKPTHHRVCIGATLPAGPWEDRLRNGKSSACRQRRHRRSGRSSTADSRDSATLACPVLGVVLLCRPPVRSDRHVAIAAKSPPPPSPPASLSRTLSTLTARSWILLKVPSFGRCLVTIWRNAYHNLDGEGGEAMMSMIHDGRRPWRWTSQWPLRAAGHPVVVSAWCSHKEEGFDVLE